MNDKKRKTNLLTLAILGMLLLFSFGGGWMALPMLVMLVIALPIGIVLGGTYKNARRREGSSEDPASFERKSSQEKGSSLQQQLLDYVALDDKQDASSVLRRKRAGDEARAEALSRAGTTRPRGGGGSGVSDGMLSPSEQQHLDSLSDDRHDELLHHAQALKDLLRAGIIEQPEYQDRLHALYQDARG
ncbi:MAG: hypothetical protein RR197_06280 [Oscillospiraceae bacterium]